MEYRSLLKFPGCIQDSSYDVHIAGRCPMEVIELRLKNEIVIRVSNGKCHTWFCDDTIVTKICDCKHSCPTSSMQKEDGLHDFANGTFHDSRVVTNEDYAKVYNFVFKGIIPNSDDKPRTVVKEELEKIGYDSSKHYTYTFQYEYPDVRIVFIKNLNNYIFLL